jgi:hypothetical protein
VGLIPLVKPMESTSHICAITLKRLVNLKLL